MASEDIGQELLDAIEAGDAKAVAAAMEACCYACMDEDGDEEEDKGMPAVMIGMARRKK